MAIDQVGNAIPAPGMWRTGSTTDDELLYSAVGYTQKGITLKAGQGLVPLGTVMGMITSTKRWVPYLTGASDGSQVPRGVLRSAVETGSSVNDHEFQGNLVIRGILKASKVAGADANAKTILAARVDTVMNTFTF